MYRFCFVLGQFPITSPPRGGGAYSRRGDLTEGFLRYDFWGLIFGILRYSHPKSANAKSFAYKRGLVVNFAHLT